MDSLQIDTDRQTLSRASRSNTKQRRATWVQVVEVICDIPVPKSDDIVSYALHRDDRTVGFEGRHPAQVSQDGFFTTCRTVTCGSRGSKLA